jgi:hypothetical protein
MRSDRESLENLSSLLSDGSMYVNSLLVSELNECPRLIATALY